MSIQIVSDPNAYCTMCRQFTYKLRWLPEKNYVAGTQIEIRSHKLRAFIGWRYTAFRIEKADITFRCKARPTVSELRLNWGRILFRSTLMYGARKCEPFDFEMTVIPPIWAGINNTLSLWTIDVKNNFQSDAPEPEPITEDGSECELTVRAAPVERLSVYDSLHARHTWAVWDTRALVAFSVNSALSGEEIEVTTDERLTAHLRMSAEDALQTVEVVSDGNVCLARQLRRPGFRGRCATGHGYSINLLLSTRTSTKRRHHIRKPRVRNRHITRQTRDDTIRYRKALHR